MTYDLNSYARGTRSVLTAQDERRFREIVREEIAAALGGEKVSSFARRAVADGLERGTDGRLRRAVRAATHERSGERP